ncbi:MAG TPA: hypothetical protein PLG90_04420 [Ignavibacteria bacterium]|nr:hypothetical protein [Ignavibacteria bacterium]
MNLKNINTFRNWYSKLIKLYPEKFYKRFAHQMEQTFNDQLKEKKNGGNNLTGFIIYTFLETFSQIFKSNLKNIFMNHKSLIKLGIGTILILMIPLIAMQFTIEVNWNFFDFAIMFIMIFGTGSAFLFISKKAVNWTYKIAVALAVITSFLIIWSNLAVGIIGNEDNPANLLFFVVIAIGLIGIIISQFKPLGMSNALFATAIAQFLVPFIALAIWQPEFNSGVIQVIAFNFFFVFLWILSALLFRKSSELNETKLKTIS